MSQDVLAKETNRRQLQQIISGLSDGIILAEVDQTILWANEAALTMHGVDGRHWARTPGYAERFTLRYRNQPSRTAGQLPDRPRGGGDEFSDVVVEVTPIADGQHLGAPPAQPCDH